MRLFYAEAEKRVPPTEAQLRSRSAELRGREQGRTAFVFGTAPSLNKYDLSGLDGDVTIGVNAFFRHPVTKLFSPSYYVLMDSALFDDPTANKPFFDDLRAACPTSRFLMPALDEPARSEHGYLPADRTYHFTMDGSLDEGGIDDLDFAGLLPGLLNSVQFGVGLAMYLGCSRIYIMGADHDWLARNCERNMNEDPHFYSEKTLDRAPRASDADPFANYGVLMEYCLRLWRSYAVLNRIAQRRGQQIFVSKESYLDVFPPFDFDRLMEARKRG